MGGFFAPDPPAPQATPASVPVSVANPEMEAAKARRESVDRNRRGLVSTIATSETGVFQPAVSKTGKTLLGE